MSIQGNSNLINQICANSGLSGPALEALRERLQKLSRAELQSEFARILSPKNSQNPDKGLVVEKNPAEITRANSTSAASNINTENPQTASHIVPASTQDADKIPLYRLQEQQAKELTIQMLDDNITQAVLIYNSQDLGAITGAWDRSKGKNNKLASSNVKKVLDYEQAGLSQIIEAKNGKLSRKAYFEENKQRIKDMILTRLNVLETPTGVKFIDKLRGNSSQEELTKNIENYIESMCSNASMKDLKDIQKQFLSLSSTEEAEALINFVKYAKKYNEKFTPKTHAAEGDSISMNAPEKGLIPEEWNSDEAITFEEVYEIERGVPYSQLAVERYQETKAEMEMVASAFNKKQQFVDFAQSLQKEDLTPDEKSQKLLEGFANFYLLSEDGGISQIKKLIDKSNLPILLDENGFDLSALTSESAKENALNSLLKLAVQEKEKDFKEFLDGRSLEDYQKAFETSADNIIGPENGKILAEAMKNDNLTVIQRFSGNASLIGIGLIVVGGTLCIFFPPAGAAAAASGTAIAAGTTAAGAASAGAAATIGTIASGTALAGNLLALGSMAAKSGLGAAELATKNNPAPEEYEELVKDFIIDAGGFIIGVPAGKAGMAAFNKLIDKKLAEVFAREITAGNRLQALKTVFNNPEYLKNFMGAAGAKLGTDFTVSYLGDLAMMGVLDTKDDWKSLLKANLTGVLVGMSGDLHGIGAKGSRRANSVDAAGRNKPESAEITPNASGKAKNAEIPQVKTDSPSKTKKTNAANNIENDDVPMTRQFRDKDGKIKFELNETGEKKARAAASEIHEKAAASEKSIVKLMEDAGLGVSGKNMTHRTKSAQSLYDKIKNALCDPEKPMSFKDAVKSIKDAVGTRTELGDFDYKKHPDIVEMYKKDPKKAILMAAERQSEEYVQKIKDGIANSVNNPDKIKAVRISNYMGENGVPYFSAKQVAELQDYAAQFGVDLHVKNNLTKVRPSGYTALQMNFETKDGFVYEWQLRGSKVNKFAECEHVPYDIRENKDVTGGRAFLKNIYAPLENAVKALSDTEYANYNHYLTAYYEHLRKLELGFDSTPPKLEDFGLKDSKLKAENLELLHEISDKLKNGKITESEAVLQYSAATKSKSSNLNPTAPEKKENAASLTSSGKKIDSGGISLNSIPPAKLRAPNEKFAETDEAFSAIIKNRENDFKTLSKINDTDEFIRKGAALILDEMGLSNAPIKIEITDNLNEFSMNEAVLRISRNWAGLEKGHIKGQGDRAEILGGIAHELNHYLQNKEIYLNSLLREDEFQYNLKMTEECQNLLLWGLGADDAGSAKFPYPMEQSDFYFKKANDYMENFINYVEPYKMVEVDGKNVLAKDADGNFIIDEKAYEAYLKQLVESESLTRGDIVRDEYKKLINGQ